MRYVLTAICLVADAALAQSVLMAENPAQEVVDQPYVDITAGAYVGNDMVAVTHFSDDPWPANYRRNSGENLALASARAAVKFGEWGWTLGYVYRQDWRLTASGDTVDAYVQGEDGQITKQDRIYNLNYELNGFSADGIKLGYAWVASEYARGRLTMGVTATLLRGRSMRFDRVSGRLISSVGSARMTASRTLVDTGLDAKTGAEADGFSDFSPAQAMEVPMGSGGAMDIGMRFTADNGAYIGIAASDLAGRIKWSQVPHLRLEVTDAQVNCVADECSASRVGADWTSTYEPVVLHLSPRYLIEGAYPLNKVVLRGRLEAMSGELFPLMGIDYALTPGWKIGVDYERRFGSIGISVRSRYFFLGLTGNRFSLEDTRTLGISVGVRGAF